MKKSTAETDRMFMRRAVRLAKNAEGMTSPNPIVGAVLVKNGRKIGEGWHRKAGCPHAEIEALRSLKQPGAAKGATLYVTLEPCSTSGRTPPCCDAIIAAGIRRVVIGSLDPNPRHAGRGVGILRDHGIEVETDVLREACEELNTAFFKWITTKRPYVLLKMAQTLDGRIATESGSSKWVTGDEAARKRVRLLRLRADAILAGAETYRLDQPRLTVRDERGNVLKTPRRFIATHHPEDIAGEFEVMSADGKEEWSAFLDRMGAENVTMLLIEGGGELAASALSAGIVDGIEFHIAPKILGGRGSRPSVGGDNPLDIADAFPLKNMRVRSLGRNIMVTAEPQERGG